MYSRSQSCKRSNRFTMPFASEYENRSWSTRSYPRPAVKTKEAGVEIRKTLNKERADETKASGIDWKEGSRAVNQYARMRGSTITSIPELERFEIRVIRPGQIHPFARRCSFVSSRQSTKSESSRYSSLPRSEWPCFVFLLLRHKEKGTPPPTP